MALGTLGGAGRTITSMEIVIDVEQFADGHLSGTIKLIPAGIELPFSGILEMVSTMEELCRARADASLGDGTSPAGDA